MDTSEVMRFPLSKILILYIHLNIKGKYAFVSVSRENPGAEGCYVFCLD